MILQTKAILTPQPQSSDEATVGDLPPGANEALLREFSQIVRELRSEHPGRHEAHWRKSTGSLPSPNPQPNFPPNCLPHPSPQGPRHAPPPRTQRRRRQTHPMGFPARRRRGTPMLRRREQSGLSAVSEMRV